MPTSHLNLVLSKWLNVWISPERSQGHLYRQVCVCVCVSVCVCVCVCGRCSWTELSGEQVRLQLTHCSAFSVTGLCSISDEPAACVNASYQITSHSKPHSADNNKTQLVGAHLPAVHSMLLQLSQQPDHVIAVGHVQRTRSQTQ